MVQALSDADLARLIGLDPAVRVNLTRARRAFEQLEADGVFEGEWTKGGKMRVFGPKRGYRCSALGIGVPLCPATLLFLRLTIAP